MIDDSAAEIQAGELRNGMQATRVDDIKFDDPGVGEVHTRKLNPVSEKELANLQAVGVFRWA